MDFRVGEMAVQDTNLTERSGGTAGTKPLISIVIPVYNEEANVRAAYDAVKNVFAAVERNYDFEIIFTDNHSSDQTIARIADIAASDPRVRAVRFARNFGFNRFQIQTATFSLVGFSSPGISFR